MSRQEDFKRMAHSHDTESSKYEQQFYIDGAEDGYEYAVDKVCDIINHYCNRTGVHPSRRVDMIDHIRKEMEV